MPREAPVTRAIREPRGRVMARGLMVRSPAKIKWLGGAILTVYVAMLRGVNVGGNSLKMEWLRQACEALGLQDVRTYVQSGNIVFSSRLAPRNSQRRLRRPSTRKHDCRSQSSSAALQR